MGQCKHRFPDGVQCTLEGPHLGKVHRVEPTKTAVPKVDKALGVKLEGLYLHTFTVSGKFNHQGRVVCEQSDYVLVEHFSWMDGAATGIHYVPKVELKFYQFYRDRADMVKTYGSASSATKT